MRAYDGDDTIEDFNNSWPPGPFHVLLGPEEDQEAWSLDE